MTLKKLSQPGTHSLWFQLFQGEQLGTSLKFRGHSAGYHWVQDLDYMNVYIPVPETVRGRDVSLVIDAGGSGMTLRHPSGEDGEGEEMEICGEFSGVVAPDECSWVIDEDERGQRCVCLSLRKRRKTAGESTWWARFLKEEEAGTPQEEQLALEAARAAAAAQREVLDRELFGGALLDWIEKEDGERDGGRSDGARF